MSKGLEAFEILKQDIGACYEEELSIVETELKRLEKYDALNLTPEELKFVSIVILKDPHNSIKKLKAFLIIEDKRVDVDYLMTCDCVEEYNDRMDELCKYPEKRYLTSSEFNSVKDGLL